MPHILQCISAMCGGNSTWTRYNCSSQLITHAVSSTKQWTFLFLISSLPGKLRQGTKNSLTKDLIVCPVCMESSSMFEKQGLSIAVTTSSAMTAFAGPSLNYRCLSCRRKLTLKKVHGLYLIIIVISQSHVRMFHIPQHSALISCHACTMPAL